MSIKEIIFYSITMIYAGIILGIIIKFIEVRKPYLILFAPIIPIMLAIFNIKLLYRVLFVSEKKTYNKIKVFISYLTTMVKYYNILIQFNVNLFIDSNLNNYLKDILRDISHIGDLLQAYDHPLENVYRTNQNFMKSGLKIS